MSDSRLFQPINLNILLAAAIAILLAGCGLVLDSEERLDRAQEAIAAGDFRAAIIDAKDVLRREPDNARGRLVLARASLGANDNAAAEKEFVRAIELGSPVEGVIVELTRVLVNQGKFAEALDRSPIESAESEEDVTEIHLILGQAYLGLSQPQMARSSFDRVLQANPERVDAKLGIAASFQAEGNLMQSRSVLDEIVTSHPDVVSGWMAYGRLNLQTRSLEAAENNFKVALGLSEELGENLAIFTSLDGLANTYLAQRRTEDARPVVSRMQEIASTRLETAFLLARIAYLDSEWETAQEILQGIISAAPDHRSAQMLLGVVHLRSGNLAQAEMYLSAVVVAAPDNNEARRYLAETRLQMDKMNEAQAALSPMLSGSGADYRSLSLAARASAGMGQFDAAIGYLEESLEQNPNNLNLQFQLATTYLNAGRDTDATRLLSEMDVSDSVESNLKRESLVILTDIRSKDFDGALVKATEATKNWPQSAEAFQILGTVHAFRSEPDLARTSYEQALELAENNIGARRLIAELEIGEGNLQAAREQYLAILETRPDATFALFALAELGAQEGERLESIRWLERFRAVEASAITPRAILGRLYLLDDNIAGAEEVIEEALTINDMVAELHNILGDVRSKQERHSDAVRSYRRASEIDSDNAEYRLDYAKSHQVSGNETLANRTLEDSIDQTMLHIPSAVQLAALKVEAGDYAGAMQIAEQLAMMHPDSPTPLALIAEVHVRNGNLGAASDAYDDALNIQVRKTHALRSAAIKRRLGTGNGAQPLEQFLNERPLDDEVRAVLAETYQRDENSRGAIEEYQKLIASQPSNGVFLNNLAWVYFEANDDRAPDTARRAYELMPENGSVIDTLGWILVNTGSIEAGVELLTRATQVSGGRAQIKYHLAVALSKSGDIDRARQELEKLLSGDEKFEGRTEAQRLLTQLSEG